MICCYCRRWCIRRLHHLLMLLYPGRCYEGKPVDASCGTECNNAERYQSQGRNNDAGVKTREGVTKECDTNSSSGRGQNKVTGVDREDGGVGIRPGTGQKGHNASHRGRQPTKREGFKGRQTVRSATASAWVGRVVRG